LIGWFLSQKESVKGFTRAIFSGLPTVELARVVRDFVLKQSHISGLYHVAARPINKFDLLQLVATTYRKSINITQSDDLVIDRSLNSDKFRETTGYVAPEWPKLIEMMYGFHNSKR
jgi:dTDP-4-dehydrorhamnose reductase